MAFLGFDLEEAPSDLQPVLAFESDRFQEFDEPGTDFKGVVTGIAKFGSELIPGGRYLWQEERERFTQMSSGEKAMAVGWEGLNALMWWKGPAIARGLFKLGSKGIGKVTGGRIGKKVIQPIEDLIDIQSKSYAELASSRLKKAGFKQDEIPAVIDAARGNNNALLGAFRGRALEGKGMSRGWEKNIDMMTDPWLQFAPNKKIMADLVPETLRRKTQEGSIIRQIAKAYGKDYNPRYIDGVFERHATKYTGGEHIVRMKDATDDLVWNVLRDMQDSPKLLLKLTTPGPFASMRPMQSVFGDLNPIYGTYDDVYKVATTGIETKAKFGVEWMSLLNRMKAERGFGAIVSKTDRAGHAYEAFKPAKFYNKEFKRQTSEFMHSVRDLMQTVGNEQLDDAGRIMTLQQKTAAVERVILEARETAPKMVDLAETMWDFNNKMFEFGMLPEIERAFLKAGVNRQGLGVLNAISKEIRNTGRMKSIFNVMRKETDALGRSTIDVKNPFRRSEEIKGLLNEYKDLIRYTVTNKAFRKGDALAVNSMFNQTGGELMETLGKLMGDLTMKKGGQKYGFTSYLEGYFARIGKGSEIMPDKAIDGLPGEMKAFFTKQATRATGKQPLLGLDETMAGRISAQGNAMYLYPAIGKISKTAEGYPEFIKKHVSHYVARLAGQPSPFDHAAARFLNNMPGIKGWDGRRVRELSGVINDFTYMGFLGLKPFSAMRNMFQPLLNVPAELGGMGDFNSLLRGYYKVITDSARRAQLRDMGIITEYAPEIMYSSGMRNKVREGAMWMFRWSDESNRLVTGSAALDKWERALVKMPGIKEGKNVAQFMQKSGASKRRPWIAKEIERALTRRPYGSKVIPDMAAAERLFVRDVTAVTQYLYGALDSPLITQIGGIFGRTGAIFQSWWMNYGDMMMRWYTGGQRPGEKVNRAFTWATSSAIAWLAMNEMWGSATATRTVGLGPFPKSMVIPPTWEPIFKGLKVITTAGETAFTQDPDKLSREVKALLGTGLNFVPGGLQIKQMIRGYQKEEPGALFKSIFKLK